MKKTKNVIGPRAISHAVLSQYLKQVRINGYTNPKSAEFVDLAG